MPRCLVSSVGLLLLALSGIGGVHGGAGWEYKGPLGPDQWHKDFPHCGGRMQSPIDVETSRVLYDRHLQAFDLRQYALYDGVTMTLKNVGGHTVEVVYGGSPVTIQGGSLPDEYVLDQFHFHWGAVDDVGSEHLMDGRAAPMEMHVVHHMKKFNKSASAENPYGLAVFGFFFQIGDHNPKFDPVLVHFPDVIHTDAHKTIPPFALSDLVGDLKGSAYYRYYGSLTTPPCYETVIWTLFRDRVNISAQQLEMFRTLRNLRAGESSETPISNDFRPTQALHERRVTSNDPALLQEANAYLVADLRQEIQDLRQQGCGDTGGAAFTRGPGGGGGQVSVLVVALLVWCLCRLV